jgi:hypothetical protein
MQQRKNSEVLFPVLESCHVYKDNYYISMKNGEIFLLGEEEHVERLE